MLSDLHCCAKSLLMTACDSGFKSPSGHLFESLTCGYSQSSMTLVVTGVRRPRSDETHQAGLLVQAELVALDVLHHEARFVSLIGKEQTQAPSAQRFQSSRFSLKRRHSLIASQPHADSYVEV